MNLSYDDTYALNFWQRLQFRAESPDTCPAERADAWRRSLVQLQTLKKSGKISGQLYVRLLQQFTANYFQVVDGQEPDRGLNNFAETVLVLANGHRNDSQKWKSNLSIESLQELSVYKDLLDRAKQSSCTTTVDEIFQTQNNHTSCEVSANSPAGHNSCDNHPTIGGEKSPNLGTFQMVNQCLKDRDICTFAVDTSCISKPQLNGERECFTTNGHKASETLTPATNTVFQGKGPRMLHDNFTDEVISREAILGKEDIKEDISKEDINTMMESSSSMYCSGQRLANAGMKQRATGDHFCTDEGGRNHLKRNQSSGESNLSIPFQSSRGQNCPENTSRQGSSFQFNQLSRNQGALWSLNQGNPYVEGYCDDKKRKRVSDNQNHSDDGEQGNNDSSDFMSARQKYVIDSNKKNQLQKGQPSFSRQGAINSSSYGPSRRTLGTRRGPSRQFIPPVLNRNSDDDGPERNNSDFLAKSRKNPADQNTHGDVPEVDERLRNIEPKMVELITNEIMDHGPPLSWDDIAGLEFAKTVIKEIVVWPMLRPDIFKGLRGPPKGLLLFGPPGTGKTLIGKCIASQSRATFFSISASSLTSKWVGEGEKMVRALFAVARCHLPAVIFIDEIDSLLSQRTDGEHDASRRIKTEFLVQLDGATTNSDERLLVVGATNRPQEIDEAARRRLVKRLYIPLPEAGARKQIMSNLLCQQNCSITDQEVSKIVKETDGYSGSDMANLCREAALGPIRSITDIQCIDADQVRPITFEDFRSALHQVRASVSEKDLDLYIQWNKLYGSGSK